MPARMGTGVSGGVRDLRRAWVFEVLGFVYKVRRGVMGGFWGEKWKGDGLGSDAGAAGECV